MEIDYKKIGLKVGLEFHQRLNTKTKLFCNCPPKFSEGDPSFLVLRRQRPIAGELAEADKAALMEFEKGKDYIYQYYDDTCCAIDIDSDFPREVSKEALEIALQACKLFRLNVPDELHTMRKIVVDGSNTTGYQRSILVGMGSEESFIDTEYGKVRIKDLYLEEESATKVEEDEGKIVYRIDRLGIPLIEISSLPEIWHPKQAKEFALKIGRLLRSLKVQRGIGTIRQDVNISIKGGARIEIKGFQDVENLDKLIELEVERQLNLIKIKETLKLKGKSKGFEIKEVSEIFSNSECKILKGKKVYAIKAKGFSGIFKMKISGEKTFGREIADYAKVFGFKGILHSDEDLEKYKISKEEIERVGNSLKLEKGDLFILVSGNDEEKLKKVCNIIVKRLEYAFVGVPEETRVANPDFTTRYSRPLPGASRLYPETDLPTIKVSLDKIEVPETLDEKKERFIKIGLSEELAEQILNSYELELFEEFIKKFEKLDPKIIANTLTNIKRNLKRDYNKEVSKEELEEVFSLLEKEEITKKGILDYLLTKNLENLRRIKGKELKELVERIAKEVGKEKVFEEIMRRYGKRVEAEEVKKILS